MEGISAVEAVVVGFLVRFGLPILATAVAAWLLRRLDERWKEKAEVESIRIRSLGADVAQVRCWEHMDCAPEKRENCPAYVQGDKPCWQIFRDRDGQLLQSCLECSVFLSAPARMAA